ncbi:hypothetical protein L2E82_20795 [Cichorium intybus]|uniref:Uncharacterized protein n=1 Tax=Cichorium intybus TaxID=13427 RepID=A0ACB9DV37_CICIN|nr:hypothetical protein L2E82_20795 [Cichorium intybus]
MVNFIEMALETYRKRSRDGASSSRQRSDSPPRIDGVRFSDFGQRDRFVALQEREVVSQKFICVDTLQEIGVFDGIQTLLNNLGWGMLMDTPRHLQDHSRLPASFEDDAYF